MPSKNTKQKQKQKRQKKKQQKSQPEAEDKRVGDGESDMNEDSDTSDATTDPKQPELTKPELCEQVISMLENIAMSLPKSARPSFWYNKDRTLIRFPYERSTRKAFWYHSTPDIIMSFPGQPKDSLFHPPGSDGPNWHNIALVVQVYTHEFTPGDKTLFGPDESSAELEKSAVNLRVAHYAHTVFALSVHGRNTAAIWEFSLNPEGVGLRCDVVTDYWQKLERVKTLLVDVCCPPGTIRVLGHDPTLRRASAQDIEWAKKQLEKGKKAPMEYEDRLGCHWVTVPDSRQDAYLIVRVLFIKVHVRKEPLILWEVLSKGEKRGKTAVIKYFYRNEEPEGEHGAAAQKAASGEEGSKS